MSGGHETAADVPIPPDKLNKQKEPPCNSEEASTDHSTAFNSIQPSKYNPAAYSRPQRTAQKSISPQAVRTPGDELLHKKRSGPFDPSAYGLPKHKAQQPVSHGVKTSSEKPLIGDTACIPSVNIPISEKALVPPHLRNKQQQSTSQDGKASDDKIVSGDSAQRPVTPDTCQPQHTAPQSSLKVEEASKNSEKAVVDSYPLCSSGNPPIRAEAYIPPHQRRKQEPPTSNGDKLSSDGLTTEKKEKPSDDREVNGTYTAGDADLASVEPTLHGDSSHRVQVKSPLPSPLDESKITCNNGKSPSIGKSDTGDSPLPPKSDPPTFDLKVQPPSPKIEKETTFKVPIEESTLRDFTPPREPDTSAPGLLQESHRARLAASTDKDIPSTDTPITAETPLDRRYIPAHLRKSSSKDKSITCESPLVAPSTIPSQQQSQPAPQAASNNSVVVNPSKRHPNSPSIPPLQREQQSKPHSEKASSKKTVSDHSSAGKLFISNSPAEKSSACVVRDRAIVDLSSPPDKLLDMERQQQPSLTEKPPIIDGVMFGMNSESHDRPAPKKKAPGDETSLVANKTKPMAKTMSMHNKTSGRQLNPREKPSFRKQASSNKTSGGEKMVSIDNETSHPKSNLKANVSTDQSLSNHKSAFNQNSPSNNTSTSHKKTTAHAKSTLKSSGSSRETPFSQWIWPGTADDDVPVADDFAWDNPKYMGNRKSSGEALEIGIEAWGKQSADDTKDTSRVSAQRSREVLRWGPLTVKIDPRLSNAKDIADEWTKDPRDDIPWGDDPQIHVVERPDFDTHMRNWERAVDHAQNNRPKKAKSSHWKNCKPPKVDPKEDPFEQALQNPMAGVRWDDEEDTDDGDPYHDIKKLAGWDGRFQPPPEDWANRDQVVYSADKVADAVWKWMLKLGETGCKLVLPDLKSQPEFDDGLEVVPRAWLPSMVGGHKLREFWQIFQSAPPEPVDPDDICDPFWERYIGTKSFVAPLVHPGAALDLKDFNNRHEKAKHTAQELVLDCKKIHLEKLEKFKDKKYSHEPIFTAEEEMRMAHVARSRINARLKNVLKDPEQSTSDARAVTPMANVYLRPVKPSDISGIAEVYNHYVLNTFSAPEFNAVSVSQMGDRVNRITSDGLPFIVAVSKANRPRGPHTHVQEKIVGYISLDDVCGRYTMMRHTFELELYVHPNWVKKGVGSCLMDRLLHMTCNRYMYRGGYDYESRSEYLKNGSSRVVKNIKIELPVDCRMKPNWQRAFFEGFGFKRVGHAREVGYKYSNIVDIVSFQYTTDEIIDPNAAPN